MLVFSCANTLIAYGAFAEALQHWEASRIGALLSLAPVFTLIGMRAVQAAAPGFAPPEQLNVWSVLGALMVVAGSAMCALGSRK
jgi:drug/metabolite transporter (DMT)-like permease